MTAPHNISIHIWQTPEGVRVDADGGNLRADDGTALVACALLRFADGLFVGGLQVRLDPAVAQVVLP